jgi:hypothetical protein
VPHESSPAAQQTKVQRQKPLRLARYDAQQAGQPRVEARAWRPLRRASSLQPARHADHRSCGSAPARAPSQSRVAHRGCCGRQRGRAHLRYMSQRARGQPAKVVLPNLPVRAVASGPGSGAGSARATWRNRGRRELHRDGRAEDRLDLQISPHCMGVESQLYLAGAQGTKEMMPLEKASGLLIRSFLIWRRPLEKASGLVGTTRPLSYTRI